MDDLSTGAGKEFLCGFLVVIGVWVDRVVLIGPTKDPGSSVAQHSASPHHAGSRGAKMSMWPSLKFDMCSSLRRAHHETRVRDWKSHANALMCTDRVGSRAAIALVGRCVLSTRIPRHAHALRPRSFSSLGPLVAAAREWLNVAWGAANLPTAELVKLRGAGTREANLELDPAEASSPTPPTKGGG